LLPDLDCKGARASRLLGPVTGGISWLLRRASSSLYRATKGPRDENGAGTHRHLTHTFLGALAFGGLAAGGIALGGPWVALGVLLLGILLAEDALGNWILKVAGLAAVGLVLTAWTGSEPAAMLTAMLATLSAIGGWLGISVTAGCLVHLLGDALTYAGLPLWFPIKHKGEVWYETGIWKPLRFRAGGDFEKRFMFPAFAVLGVLLIPGVWTLAWTATEGLYTAIHQAAALG
jgi:membrane-bound metal-dependent hydrolase YbcI (DUF457 family)